MNILITGGGSGGHVSPALAVAKQLQQVHPQVNLLYIGGTMTMEGATGPSIEQTMAQAAQVPFVAISAGKLKRDGISLTTLRRLVGVIPGFFQAFQHIRRFKPNVVFSSGGYVSVPVVVAAWLLRVPIVIHEQTAAVGLANNLAARVATVVAVTFPQSAAYFNPTKTIITGNPLNQAIITPDKQAIAPSIFGQWLAQPSSLPLIYITGGGLGSHKINQAVEQILPDLLRSYRLVHQTGNNQHFADYDRLSAAAAQLPADIADNYWIAKHFTAVEIGCLYQQATIVVGRAGANTVLELAYWATPTIFIPISWVTHDEQTKNAQTLVEAGTAVILKEQDLSGPTLLSAIQDRLAALPLSAQAQRQAKNLVKLTATQQLVDILLQQGQKG